MVEKVTIIEILMPNIALFVHLLNCLSFFDRLIDDQNITNEDSTGNMTYYGLTLNQFHTHQQVNIH